MNSKSTTPSPTGRLVESQPNLQTICISTPESRRVIEAFRKSFSAAQPGAKQ